MKKLTNSDPETKSPDLEAQNIATLNTLFPELVTESEKGAAVNGDVLKQLVGDQTVTDMEEKYGLNWHGKRSARQLALTPSTGTLRPSPEESVDWDTTQNLIIEGDNLEVLKLLQKSFAGKVKLIYIDPPYNTGKDFVYPDHFQDSIRNYLELTGQVEGGAKISSNAEASGRFHTDWLNMMYPRLKLAQNLLRKDGAIFISVGDEEIGNLRSVCAEIFGEENYLGQVSRITKTTSDAGTFFAPSIDFVLVYGRLRDNLEPFKVSLTAEQISDYKKQDERGKYKLVGFYQASLTLERSRNARYAIEAPDGSKCLPPDGKRWRTIRETYDAFCSNNEIEFVRVKSSPLVDEKGRQSPWNVYTKQYLSRRSEEGLTPRDFMANVPNYLGAEEVEELDIPFSFPKPTALPRIFMEMVGNSHQQDIVLDFFAGSGTTGHAVMAQNAADSGRRRYILVQLPEPLDPETKDQKVAADFCDKLKKPRNIAELTKERLRRAVKKIQEESPKFAGDLGFRVFKLDSTNIREWQPKRDNLPQTLEESVEHLKTDRRESDILYELLLKLGLDLCVPIEKRTIAGKDVHAIGGGVLMACLAEKITTAEVEKLGQGIVGWHKSLAPAGDTTCVFRDSAFADDVAKTNMDAILEQNGIGNVRSL